jgi:hypothetical protein
VKAGGMRRVGKLGGGPEEKTRETCWDGPIADLSENQAMSSS